MTDDTKNFCAIGEALFGSTWQTAMAGALDVTVRTVQRWVAGARVPAGVWDEIETLCRTRAQALDTWATVLAAAKRARA